LPCATEGTARKKKGKGGKGEMAIASSKTPREKGRGKKLRDADGYRRGRGKALPRRPPQKTKEEGKEGDSEPACRAPVEDRRW